DLVLLDLMLPTLSGLEVCRRVRMAPSAVHLPIIMITGLGGDAPRSAGFAAGADDYVVKPFSAEDLLSRVEVWARARRRLLAAHAERLQLQAERLARARLEGV